MQDSLAKTLASLENRPDLEKALAAGFIEKSCVLLASLDPATSSWKTFPQLDRKVLKRFSQTWPRWGMTVGGAAYEHPMSVLRMGAIDGGSAPNKWATPNTMDRLPGRSYEAMKRQATNGGRKNRSRPSNLREQIDPLMCQAYVDAKVEANEMKFATPQARDFRSGQSSRWDDPSRSRNLNDQIAKFPTPSATDYKGPGATGSLRDRLDYAVERGATKSKTYEANTSGGKLNPNWVAWLMNWPLTWCHTKHFKAGGKSNRTSDGQPT
jgi:hypothetical protein